jgi:hypothetical protein
MRLTHFLYIFVLHFSELEVERSDKRLTIRLQDYRLVIDCTIDLKFLKKCLGISAWLIVGWCRLSLLIAVGVRLDEVFGFVVESVEYHFGVVFIFVHDVQI